MAILFVVLKHENFEIALRAEKNLLTTIVGFTNAILLQFQGRPQQRLSHVEQIGLGEEVLGHLFLLDCLGEGEVVVVGVGVEFLVFDAEMDF